MSKSTTEYRAKVNIDHQQRTINIAANHQGITKNTWLEFLYIQKTTNTILNISVDLILERVTITFETWSDILTLQPPPDAMAVYEMGVTDFSIARYFHTC